MKLINVETHNTDDYQLDITAEARQVCNAG